MSEIFYHGGPKFFDKLTPGRGIDGKGIYLTDDLQRAIMYASKGIDGVDRTPHIMEVNVNTDGVKVWDAKSETANIDLRDFMNETNKHWINELQEKYGEKGVIHTGSSAMQYLFGANGERRNEGLIDTQMLKDLGYKAIRKWHDFIVLDDSIIQSIKPLEPLPTSKKTNENKYSKELLNLKSSLNKLGIRKKELDSLIGKI